MDGCVSKPVNKASLLNTVAAAVPNPPGSPPRVTHSAETSVDSVDAPLKSTVRVGTANFTLSPLRAARSTCGGAHPHTHPVLPLQCTRAGWDSC
jgi:hypothetical protein